MAATATIKQVTQNSAFLYRRPLLFARALCNVALVVVGIPRLRSIDIDLTHRCPCKCAQCYADGSNSGEELRVDEIAHTVQQARRLGALQVNLSGGEPLVRRGLDDIIRVCDSHRTLVTMCSSGVGLDVARLERLRSAGLGVLILSLDSPEPEEHDRNRGIPDLFATVMDAVRNAREMGLGVLINTVATRGKLADGRLEALRSLALGNGVTLNITIPVPQGRWQDAEGEMLSDEERRQIAAFLGRPGTRTDTFSTYWHRGCPAGCEKISVAVDGEVRPCQLLPVSYGNVRETPLWQILDRMREEAAFRHYQPYCPAGDPHFRSRHPALVRDQSGSAPETP